jgi:hypothetical protein
VYGGTPPAADRLAEYPAPTVALGSDAVVTLSGAITKIERGIAAWAWRASLTRAVKEYRPV